ncbi:MAG: response regulator [bacterium]
MKYVEVLMVEDNRGDVVLVQEAIQHESLPYNMTVASDGVEAMDYLQRQIRRAGAPRPDLIILDVQLPRKTGTEVLAEIEANPAFCGIPTVIFSSSLGPVSPAAAGKGCFHMHVSKPAKFAGYVALVRTIEEFRKTAKGDAKP